MLERLLEQRPKITSLIREIASLVTSRRAEWSVLEPVELKSQGGAILTRQTDGSILASGPNPDSDTYTVTAKTRLKRITGLQVEGLEDPSLPGGGPGRHESGFFRLSGLSF